MIQQNIQGINQKLIASILPTQQANGCFEDSVYKLERTRSTAEIAKGLYDLSHENEAIRAIDFVLGKQNKNGSWNEEHLDLQEESCVATAIIGLTLLKMYSKTKNKKYLESAERAGEYLLSKEVSSGYFIKSAYHYANVLNVNANAAAFLYALYSHTTNKKYLEARDRAIFNVVKWQFKNGAYPYTSPEQTFPYTMHYNVPDFHYHTLTLYYLLQADPKLENRYIQISVQKALEWLEKNLSSNGWNWEKNKLMFSLGSTASYAYAAFSFQYMNKAEKAEQCINKLKSLQEQGIFNRDETPTWPQTLIGGMEDVLNVDMEAMLHYPFLQRLGLLKERMKKKLLAKNEKSVYYSAQILECLTEIKEEKQ